MRKIFGVLILLLFMASCKKHTCEGFPEGELKWTPFDVNKNLKYVSDADTLELTITDKFHSTESKYSGEPDPEYCIPESWYRTNEFDNFSIYEKVDISYGGSSYMTTNFSSNNIFQYELRDGYYSNSISVRHIGDTLINDIQLYEVFKIAKDSQDGIDWFIKAAHRGIISFGDKDINKIWEQIQ